MFIFQGVTKHDSPFCCCYCCSTGLHFFLSQMHGWKGEEEARNERSMVTSVTMLAARWLLCVLLSIDFSIEIVDSGRYKIGTHTHTHTLLTSFLIVASFFRHHISNDSMIRYSTTILFVWCLICIPMFLCSKREGCVCVCVPFVYGSITTHILVSVVCIAYLFLFICISYRYYSNFFSYRRIAVIVHSHPQSEKWNAQR